MRSRIELHLPEPTSVSLSFEELNDLSQFPLEMGEASHIRSREGKLLIQSVSHYLAHIQLYEYKITRQYLVDFEIKESSIFLSAVIEGSSMIYDEHGKALTDFSGSSCRLTFLNAGKYKRRLTVGDHKILVVALRPEWLIKNYGEQAEIQELLACYNNSEEQFFALPDFNMAQHAFNALKKLNEAKDFDIEIHLFTNDCLNKYLSKLQTKVSNTDYQGNKAKEIADFITQNFTSKIVDDEHALAKHFMTSKITLTRLAKLYFGRPLHKQVIELRMLTGLKMLRATKKTISEIAQIIGYEDPHYFSRAFKKRFGVSPNLLRTNKINLQKDGL